MKNIISLITIIICAQYGQTYGQAETPKNKNYHHGICYEFAGTGVFFNVQYLYLKKIRNTGAFIQTDAIAGYKREKVSNTGFTHGYNFSIATNFGFLHQSGRSILLGCGLGYDRGLRVAHNKIHPPDKTNKSIVTYLRINYSRRLINERLIFGFSMVYGIKLIELASSTDPHFNEEINAFQNWFFPGISIGFCFGKKYFQKEKSGTE